MGDIAVKSTLERSSPTMNVAHRYSVAAHYVRLLTDYCEQRDLSTRALLTGQGLNPGALDDPNGRLPFVAFDRMLSTAAGQLGDAHLGLHLGQAARIGHLGISGLLQAACSNGWEMLPKLMRYSSLTMTAFRDDFVVEAESATVLWRSELPADMQVSRHQAELNFALSITLASQLVGGEVRPLHVQFRHAADSARDVVEAYFRCPVTWQAEVDSLTFPTALLHRPINIAADPASLQALEALCVRQLEAIQNKADPEWLRATRAAIADALPEGPVVLRAVALHAGCEARQLQKRLADQGLSFRRLVDNVRRELAEVHLSSTDMSLVEIAVRLGFSEQSAFQRAYRRWSDLSPGQARRSRGRRCAVE